MSDGPRLRQSWYSALNDAETHFRQLLISPAGQWKRLPSSIDTTSSKQKGKARASSSTPELADVIAHRNSTKIGDDVYRLVLDVPTGDEQVSLEPWKAVLTTPELRQEWDPSVGEAHLLEMFDHDTRISKTNYTLGWPANPRDAITISRSFSDTTTFIDISTSLPRSPDEPAYLRPSPPFVRSHVKLFAWCIQHIQPQSSPSEPKKSIPGRLRLTCFCQHDLKALWGFGYSISALTQQLSTMTLSLLKTVMKRGSRVPKLTGYGNGVSIGRIRYQLDREALTVDYTIIPDDDDHTPDAGAGLQGMDEVHALRENRRLTRSVECILPSLNGWDVQVTMKGSDEEVGKLPWSAHALRNGDSPNQTPTANTFPVSNHILFRVTHSSLTSANAILRVKLVIEVAGASRGLRLNGLAKPIHSAVKDRDPSSLVIPQRILQDIASVQGLSFGTLDSAASDSTVGSSSSSLGSVDAVVGRPLITERSAAAEKTILSKVRRNYIYFSSLLQEPEAKWRRTTEARGVSITQLDSIDPTLVVYRAEATFVGVGLWDLYGAVVSPGARAHWDRQHEDGVLLEDVNELTELWHFKTKPAWPVNGRDSVVLKTVYKSPTTIHVFSFSADDLHLFPHIPPVELNVIRTQVDLQGWAIEALSPTTTSLTLLEQSDPKGWSNKTSIPTQMIGTMAGIGEFAIKCGGPPVVSRMAGAKVNEMRYDHEKGSFKVEYEPSSQRMTKGTSRTSPSAGDDEETDNGLPAIECEIRCDIDTWAGSLDIVVDPPPQSVTCLRRHRFSTEGGGLWLTLTHDAIFVDDPRLLALVRRGPGKEKGLVMVNGARVQVDVEEMAENEIKTMMKQKRVKPVRIPLDQPPVIGAIRRRRAEWSGVSGSSVDGQTEAAKKDETEKEKDERPSGNDGGFSSWASAPKLSSPLARFFTYAVDQATTTTQQAVAAISPVSATNGAAELDPTKMPMQYALEALAWTQQFNNQSQSAAGQEGWTTLVSEKGLSVQKKIIPEISPFIPVHRGVKVIEGVSAEELAEVIMEFDCRKTWDDRYDSARVLESYGGSARTMFFIAKAGFPFRDRGLYLANVTARAYVPASSSPSMSRRNTGTGSSSSIGTGNNGGNGGVGEASDHPTSSSSTTSRNAIFCVSASFSPDSPSMRSFSAGKYNPYILPIGRVYVDAWILETLDPYTKENYAIPSTRCTRLVAVDFRGSIPAAVNGMINVGMARGVIGVEAYMKNASSGAVDSALKTLAAAVPLTRLPAPGMVLSEKKGEDSHVPSAMVVGVVAPFMAWKLRKRDENRVLVETRFDVESKVYKTTVFVCMGVSAIPAIEGAVSTSTPKTKPLGDNGEVTPRSSRLALNSSPHSSRTIDSIDPSLQPSNSDSALLSPSSLSSQLHSGLSMPMPGSMIMSPTFPAVSTPSTTTSTTLSSASTSTITLRSSTSSKSPTPHNRQRAASSGSGNFNPSLHSHGPVDGSLSRGRTMASAFTVKGEVKPLTDLVVAEIVVDSKLYGAGSGSGESEAGATGSGGVGYCVEVKARKRDGKVIPLSPPGTSVPIDASANATSEDSASSSKVSASSSGEEDLPFVYTIHTMPSSPLHSSGLHAGSPSRHLLRVTLPTAQYRMPTVKEDPLTGEARSARPRPAWMEELEREGGGWVVGVEIKPSSGGDGKGNETSKKSQGMIVLVNGKEVVVLGEKESLTNLGRDELLDDRMGRMGVLSRTPNESEPLPSELKEPIAIADDLLDPPTPIGDSSVVGVGLQTMVHEESKTISGDGEETPGKPKMEMLVQNVSGGPHVSHAGPSGLLGLWQTYGPNPLTRLGGGGAASVAGALIPGGLSDMKSAAANFVEEMDGDDKAQNRTAEMYPLSTVLLVGLIAFLIGSLLRSLLSPADFIYVVTDLKEAEEANVVGGWREIRRIFEIKYLIGGWDFQVAVVRRR
ncbi:hypothetical protein BYT27DRAFT_7186494 [Phlegmacium glaucopus]|nr:hypothetical protein BYT27DRAFT_7186494 [Phlegmacium glaucopus]